MAIYYVDMLNGLDTNSGLTEALAFKTLGKAATTVVAGDKVWVEATADYTETLTISVVGTSTTPIIWEGYTSTPGDRGMITINGGAARVTGIVPAAGSNFNVFKDFRVTNHTGLGAGSSTVDHLTFKKCRFDNNGGAGVTVDENCLFEGCYAHNNTSNGFRVASADPTAFICCISNSNGASGFSFDTGLCYRCIAYNNATYGFESTLTYSLMFLECVADGNGKVTDGGFRISIAYDQAQVTVVNCIGYDCTVGFRGAPGTATERSISRNNLTNSNTTAYTNLNTFEGAVTGAPAFVNEAAQDYGLTASSPAKGAGYGVQTEGWITMTGDNPDIGPMDEVGSVGGGGLKAIKTGGAL